MKLTERLRAACNGHPHAKIPWPHRILHEAADAIEQRDALVEQAFRDGMIYGNNVIVTDPDEAWRTSRARAALRTDKQQ